jgi:hypothetical protein
VSDYYLRLIPTDPTWQPDEAAARRAAETLAALVPDADPPVVKLYEEVTFIDQGGNFARVLCPACGAELPPPWWSQRMDDAFATRFARLTVETPCCGVRVSLNDLTYDWPAGFARAELSVLGPPAGGLSEPQLARVGRELGHPLRQVIARY